MVTVIVKVRQMPEKLASVLVKKIIFLGGKFSLIPIHFVKSLRLLMILCLRVLTTLPETHPQRHHTKFPFLQTTRGKRCSFVVSKSFFLLLMAKLSLIGIFGEQMNDSSVKPKQTKFANENSAISLQVTEPVVSKPDAEEIDEDSDPDSGGEMVDGILTSGIKSTYEIPSQEELILCAFAGDDVEDEFEREKQDALNEEVPEPEKPVLLPGWGQWTSIQKKRGPPSWMLQEHDNAEKKREEALKKRKDANLNHVIISEKRDKKIMCTPADNLFYLPVPLALNW
ncbi:hypothetical protein FXO38_19118 [Capsicum annuum]|uniref:Uncharacterized protein n=1 Tax=Capsicum annuum TaxID=4072 RepID=A0A2G2XWX9_CAPAN|nr:hypothetical protein FXO38_19118 [Capsicum annuum]PHT61995.1 hypothetical protein T459_34152 [Capsicum annuum]